MRIVFLFITCLLLIQNSFASGFIYHNKSCNYALTLPKESRLNSHSRMIFTVDDLPSLTNKQKINNDNLLTETCTETIALPKETHTNLISKTLTLNISTPLSSTQIAFIKKQLSGKEISLAGKNYYLITKDEGSAGHVAHQIGYYGFEKNRFILFGFLLYYSQTGLHPDLKNMNLDKETADFTTIVSHFIIH